ncbi:hypothetical protein DFH09DRAFT_906830, partial [Mycena vulgaris]
FAKYFGSGVIMSTDFIHLLSPALEALASPCLSPGWFQYPYALALCMLSIFSIFILKLVAFRWGTAKVEKLGIRHDPHGHYTGSHAAHGPEGAQKPRPTSRRSARTAPPAIASARAPPPPPATRMPTNFPDNTSNISNINSTTPTTSAGTRTRTTSGGT